MGFIQDLWSGKGTVHVNIDKPYYMSGELVTGSLSVSIRERIECTQVVVIVSGKEKVHWSETHTTTSNGQTQTHTRHFSSRNEFFKQTLVLFNVQHSLAPGEYLYPFQYQLPNGLPGCFDNQGGQGVSAKIEYSIKGSLNVQGMFNKDLKHRQCLTLYAQLVGVVAPSVDQKVQIVRLFCCFSQGQCSLRAAMDKNMYGPGETPQIQVDVKNDSKREIRMMRCELRRHVIVRASGRTRGLVQTICTARFPGVPPKGAVSQPQPFQLTGTGMYPSTQSSLITCNYSIDIVCDIALCPDVELHLPIALGAPTLVPVVPQPTNTPPPTEQPTNTPPPTKQPVPSGV